MDDTLFAEEFRKTERGLELFKIELAKWVA